MNPTPTRRPMTSTRRRRLTRTGIWAATFGVLAILNLGIPALAAAVAGAVS